MKIKVGSKIPEFTLPDQDGNSVNIKKIIGAENLVIYFYPKDDTPGCTKEACSFRDQFEDFNDLGAKVIGISSDSVKKHKNFAEKHRLPYRLLSDVDNSVRKAFGVPADLFGLLPGRVTYIVDKKGIVRHIFNSQFNAEKHVSEALEVLKDLG
jgi:peroxiredoxin Q/BCP